MKYRLTVFLVLLMSIAFSQSFYPLDPVGLNQTPEAMCVYKNELYVGGDFTTANNIPVNCVARWNGAEWHSVGNGVNLFTVKCFTVHNNILYMGGEFQCALDSIGNCIPNTNRLIGWDGINIVPLGINTNSPVAVINTLASYQGSLYIGGHILNIGSLAVNRIARWDGVNWHAVCTNIVDSFGSPEIRAMAVFQNELYVGGCFSIINGVAASNIARWDGSQWHAVGSGANGCVASLFNDTITNLLFIGGGFNIIGGYNLQTVGIWNGSQYLLTDTCSNGGAFSFARYNNKVFVVGPGCNPPFRVFSFWDGMHWNAIPQFQNGADVLCTYNNELYLGGSFPEFSDPAMMYIARMTMPNNIEQKKNSEYFLGDNVPNPFNLYTTIPYYLPIGSKGKIYICNMQGTDLMNFNIEEGYDALQLNPKKLSSGVYLYCIEIDGIRKEYKKMTVIK